MRFGVLHLFEKPAGKPEHRIVKEQLELMIAAEEVVKTYESYNAFKNVAQKLDFELLTDLKYVIAGSPDYVVEELTKAQEIYNMTELLCWTRLGGLENDKVLHSMELMRDRVFPRVRSLSAPAPPRFEINELQEVS